MTPRSLRYPLFVAVAAASLCLLAACADEDGSPTSDAGNGADTADTGGDASDDTDTPEPLAIAGAWVDDFGGGHTISSDLWDMEYAVFHVVSYDNDAQVVIAQNDAANEFSPSLWSRLDWTYDGDGKLWFCQNPYDAASADAAAAAERADDADPATSGCNGFSWSGLNPAATE